jgi:hypothetical protein
MPAIGIILLLAQIICAVHVARTGRNYYWIYLIVFVPVVGMAAYFFAELLPELVQSRTARQAASGVVKALNPGKELREALRRVEITPTAANKAALAEAYLAAGEAAEARSIYREALVGIHATDPTMMLGLARAAFAAGDAAETQSVLEQLREANPSYNSPEGHLLYAQSLERQGKTAAALEEYRALAVYYPGQEARCRYGLLLQAEGQRAEARRVFEEVRQLVEYGPPPPAARATPVVRAREAAARIALADGKPSGRCSPVRG